MSRPNLSAISLFLILLPVSAAACTCAVPKPYAERRLDYDFVFHGRVIDSELDDPGDRRWIRFHLVKDYGVTAAAADTLTVWTGIHGGFCGVEYPIGYDVLVFADTGNYPPQGKVLQTSLCAGNASGPGLEKVLDDLEATLNVRPAGRGPGTRRERAQVDCGRILFEGGIQANGARRRPSGSR